MSIVLEDYQRKAVSNLSEMVDKKVLNEVDNQVYLKAVTGAGKTVIMGEYLRYALKNHPEYRFFWLSPGKGDLTKQSFNSLNSNLIGSNVVLLREDYKFDSNGPQKNTVYVVNWEKIWSDKTNLMKGGENITFIEFVNSVKEINSNNKVIFIIDEAHIGEKSSDKVELDKGISKIKNEVNIDLFIKVSATPKVENESDIISVDIQDVKKSGRIKQGIRFSHNFDEKAEGESIWEKILVAAINERQDLMEKYKQLNCKINPLCLIQVPNRDKISKNDESVDLVLDILRRNGYTRDNGSVSVYLTNDKDIDMDEIKRNNNSVSFIICKEGITLGWDCPRAQILVCFRDSKSIIFNLQTVGRILRMPYGEGIQKGNNNLFDIDDLNYAYVYSDNSCQIDPYLQSSEMSFVSQELRTDKVKIKDKLVSIYDDVKSLNLNRIKRKAVNENISDNILYLKVKDYIDSNKDNFDLSYNDIDGYIADGDISVENIQSKVRNENKHYILSDADVKKRFDLWINSLSCSYYNISSFTNMLYDFCDCLINDEDRKKNPTISLKRLLYKNRTLIERLSNIIRKEKKDELDKLTSYIDEIYVFENQRYGRENTSKDSWRYSAYTNQRIDKGSSPEEHFEYFLDNALSILPDGNNSKVVWWIKNIDVNGFSISYMEHNENGEELGLRGFNPDYVVRFSNGDLGLYEVKSSEDKSSNIGDKELALKEYVEGLKKVYKDINIYGAIVRVTKDGRNDLVDLPK